MTYLEVVGASLYYETSGTGPLLLCISGANGSAEAWRPLASYLQDTFTVVGYDRRGFSRSYLSRSQDYEHRLETDADDAASLIKHLSPKEPATVIGNSSGAIVALTLLTRHPEVLRTLIAHEPPAMKLLPDFEELWAKQQDAYDTYRAHGVPPAMEKFMDLVMISRDAGQGMVSTLDPSNNPFMAGNTLYWFEREVLVYPQRDFDLEAIAKQKDLLMLGNADESNREALQYRGNVVLGEKVGSDVKLFSGGHVGFTTHAKEFARELRGYLKERSAFYAEL